MSHRIFTLRTGFDSPRDGGPETWQDGRCDGSWGVSGGDLRVLVLGQGYVGLPLAMRAVEVGHTVVGYDINESRVKRLCSGESYVEDISSATLAAPLETGRYTPSAE